MIIEHLYETRLDCTDYNPSIYETPNDLIIVTVTLKDFNQNNVVGKSVTLTVDKGYFTKTVGQTSRNHTGTSTKTTTMNTDSNGQVKVTYAPSESGLCTFSCNNSKVQCYVNNILADLHTWTDVPMSYIGGDGNVHTPGQMVLKVNEYLQLAILTISNTSANFKASTQSGPSYNQIIPEGYRPPNQVIVPTFFNKGKILISSEGSVYFLSTDGNSYTGENASCTLLWHYGLYSDYH